MCRCRMKQIEITVRLTEKIEEAIAKLEKRGFKRIRESDIHDIYMSNIWLGSSPRGGTFQSLGGLS